MKEITGRTMDEERALYGEKDLVISDCSFAGPADGESALKECMNVEAENIRFDLRYPCWHDRYLKLRNSEMTDKCRAALWYCDYVDIFNTKLHGVKALRECSHVIMSVCDIISPEFGWSVDMLNMHGCTVENEYFLMRSSKVHLEQVKLKGKYSFQYVKDAEISDCEFDTKDAFWHSKNVTVTDSVINGEYLAWYSKNLTLINCTIRGTQPFCYCKGLNLINCRMEDTDLCFERSEVKAEITTPVISIKNPLSGEIRVPKVDEVIFDIPEAKGKIITDEGEA